MPKYRKGDRVLLKNGETAVITQTFQNGSPLRYKTKRDNYVYEMPSHYHGESDRSIEGLLMPIKKAWKGLIDGNV